MVSTKSFSPVPKPRRDPDTSFEEEANEPSILHPQDDRESGAPKSLELGFACLVIIAAYEGAVAGSVIYRGRYKRFSRSRYPEKLLHSFGTMG
jgi:hypothetical protein